MTIDRSKLQALRSTLAAYEAIHGSVSYTPQDATNCTGNCAGSCSGSCSSSCSSGCTGTCANNGNR